MILRSYYYDDHGCAAYVFGCGTPGRCAVVDARVDEQILSFNRGTVPIEAQA